VKPAFPSVSKKCLGLLSPSAFPPGGQVHVRTTHAIHLSSITPDYDFVVSDPTTIAYKEIIRYRHSQITTSLQTFHTVVSAYKAYNAYASQGTSFLKANTIVDHLGEQHALYVVTVPDTLGYIDTAAFLRIGRTLLIVKIATTTSQVHLTAHLATVAVSAFKACQ